MQAKVSSQFIERCLLPRWRCEFTFYLAFTTLSLELIAEGASGKVYKAKYHGKPVALKRFDVEHISFNMDDFRKELALLW